MKKVKSANGLYSLAKILRDARSLWKKTTGLIGWENIAAPAVSDAQQPASSERTSPTRTSGL